MLLVAHCLDMLDAYSVPEIFPEITHISVTVVIIKSF